jgi:TP901 family phage tail tape measure protein
MCQTDMAENRDYNLRFGTQGEAAAAAAFDALAKAEKEGREEVDRLTARMQLLTTAEGKSTEASIAAAKARDAAAASVTHAISQQDNLIKAQKEQAAQAAAQQKATSDANEKYRKYHEAKEKEYRNALLDAEAQSTRGRLRMQEDARNEEDKKHKQHAKNIAATQKSIRDEFLQTLRGFTSQVLGLSLLAGGFVQAGRFIASFVGEAVNRFRELEQEVANIKSIKPEIDTSVLYEQLSELQTRIPVESKKLAESYYNIASSIKANSSEILALTESTAKGAFAARTSTVEWATAVIGVMNAYGLTVKDTDHIQDLFFQTVRDGVINGQQLAQVMGPLSQRAKMAGASIEELTAALTIATKQGGDAFQNANDLSNFYQHFTTKEAQDHFKKLKIETIALNGGYRDMVDILTDLDAKLSGMSESGRAEVIQGIFPDRQAQAGLARFLGDLKGYREQLGLAQTESGAFSAAYATQMDTNAAKTELLNNRIKELQESWGDFVDLFGGAAQNIAKFEQQQRDIAKQYKVSLEDAKIIQEQLRSGFNLFNPADFAKEVADMAAKYAREMSAINRSTRAAAVHADDDFGRMGDAMGRATRKAEEHKKALEDLEKWYKSLSEGSLQRTLDHLADERISMGGASNARPTPTYLAEKAKQVEQGQSASVAQANAVLAQSEANIAAAEAKRLEIASQAQLSDARATGDAVKLAEANQKVAEASYARANATVKQRQADLAAAQASLENIKATHPEGLAGTSEAVAAGQQRVTNATIALTNAQIAAGQAASRAGQAGVAADQAQLDKKNELIRITNVFKDALEAVALAQRDLERQAKQTLDPMKQAWDDAVTNANAFKQASEEALFALDEQLYQLGLQFKQLERNAKAALAPFIKAAEEARARVEAIRRETELMNQQFDREAHALSERLYPLQQQYQAQQDALAGIAAKYSIIAKLQTQLNALNAEDARIQRAKQLAEEQTNIENLASQLPNLVAGSAQWLEIQKQMADATGERNRHEQQFSLEDRIAELQAAKEAEEAVVQAQMAATQERMQAIEREQALLERQRAEYDYQQRQKEIIAQADADRADERLAIEQAYWDALLGGKQRQIDDIRELREVKAHDDMVEERRLATIANNYRLFYEAYKTYFDSQMADLAQLRTDLSLLDTQVRAMMEDTGKAIDDGLVAGIDANKGLVGEAVIRAVQYALDEGKAYLGIASPSRRAAAEIGVPFIEGVADGMYRGSGALAASLRDIIAQTVDYGAALAHRGGMTGRDFGDIYGRNMGAPGVVQSAMQPNIAVSVMGGQGRSLSIGSIVINAPAGTTNPQQWGRQAVEGFMHGLQREGFYIGD